MILNRATLYPVIRGKAYDWVSPYICLLFNESLANNTRMYI